MKITIVELYMLFFIALCMAAGCGLVATAIAQVIFEDWVFAVGAGVLVTGIVLENKVVIGQDEEEEEDEA